MSGKHLPKKRKRNTSNIILAAVGVFILAFVTVMIITFWKFQAVPDTLITYTLGAGGVEAVVLAGIKISKVLRGEKGEVNDE